MKLCKEESLDQNKELILVMVKMNRLLDINYLNPRSWIFSLITAIADTVTASIAKNHLGMVTRNLYYRVTEKISSKQSDEDLL